MVVLRNTRRINFSEVAVCPRQEIFRASEEGPEQRTELKMLWSLAGKNKEAGRRCAQTTRK
jgi:hypothetical protein